jgi:phenylpropionate dioxygenase-like ring-hydroxylating dioxygenase large terminal subunit
MGDLMREYWVPAMLSTELQSPDCAPVRIRLLGEDLIAFRATSGEVGLIQNACPHRGASMFFGRNEEDGLRCVYHGWKFDVTGACVDMPSEPAESNFRNKVRTRAYRCVERGGLVWTYMGTRAEPPELPMLEQNLLPEGQAYVRAMQRECNYMQALEGDIDTSHLSFLHLGSQKLEGVTPNTFSYYNIADKAPRYVVTDTEFGTMYGAYRPAEDDTYYWRVACFLFPFYTMTPVGLLGTGGSVRAWVPMDDDHTMFFMMYGTAFRDSSNATMAASAVQLPMQPNGTGWLERYRLRANASNDYEIDRAKQGADESYTGIQGIHLQDQAITESMGTIYRRNQEHLGTSDAMVIRTRRRLINAAKQLRDERVTPPGVDQPEVYGVRTGGVILPRSVDWLTGTAELRKAFTDHPELDRSILGNVAGV